MLLSYNSYSYSYITFILTALVIDIPINDEEKAKVEELIRQEVNNYDREVQHPGVDELVPLTENRHSSLLNSEIQRYEEEEEEVGDKTSNDMILSSTITDKETNDHDEYLNLFYALNENSNLSMLLGNVKNLSDLNEQHLNYLDNMEAGLSHSLDKKRKQIDDTNFQRKKQQTDFKPVNDYLQEKWKQEVKSMVDINIETTSSK